jgi:hypothetical protein
MSSLKNIFLVLICVACGLFAYYMTRADETTAGISGNSAIREELIAKTQSFIERSNKLQQINIDQAFFMDPVFTSLRSFSTPVPNQALGRDDLFGTPSTIGTVQNLDVTE